MKLSLWYGISISLLIAPALATGAPSYLSKAKSAAMKQLAQVERLAKSGKQLEAYLLARRGVNQIYADLRVGEVVAETTSRLTEIQQQIVKQRTRRTESSEDSVRSRDTHKTWSPIRNFLLGIAADAQMLMGPRLAKITKMNFDEIVVTYRDRESSSVDVTDETAWTITNAAEIAGFSGQAASDMRSLERQLQTYVAENAELILAMKVMGVWSMKLAMDLQKANTSLSAEYEELTSLVSKLSSIRFLGESRTVLCVRKQFVDTYDVHRSDSSSTTERANGRTETLSENQGIEIRNFAHVSESCSSSLKNKEARLDSSVYEVDFNYLDRLMVAWAKAVLGLAQFGGLDRGLAPDFGNPYLTSPKK